MNPVRLLPPLALLLAMSACGGGASTNSAAANAELAANAVVANGETAAGTIDEADASAEVAPLPAPPSDLSADDAAPLVQATQVATEIAQDTSVERVPYQGGWAWRRGGQIIRTASRDGSRVSYFRPGESTPFYVQQGDRGFAYSAGRPRRAYDRSGHAAAIDAARRAEAERLAEDSRRDRDEAQQAPARPTPDRNGPDRSGPGRSDHPGANDGDHHGGPAGSDHRAGNNDDRRPDAGNDRGRDDHGDADRRRPGSRDRDDDRDGNRQAAQGH
jgi:hypothetical protein